MASLTAAPSRGDAAPRAKSSRAATPGAKKGGRKAKRGPDGRETNTSRGQIVRVPWTGHEVFRLVITDRAEEAALLASRYWLRKWDRMELPFKGLVIYTAPHDWEDADFAC